MNVLPLVHRELLTASRRPTTAWLRVGVAAVAAVVALLIIANDPNPGLAGRPQFLTLSILAFLFAALSGNRYAAIPLSEENREGTLGLLLLTPLKRRDIILGKLAGAALESVGALVAIVPVLTLALLSGGVLFGQVWMVAITLLLTLLLSTAAGLYVAAIRTNELKSMFLTALFVLGTCLPFGWLLHLIALTVELDLQQSREIAFGRLPPWWRRAGIPILWLSAVAMFFCNIMLEAPAGIVMFSSPAYLLFLALNDSSFSLFAVHAAGLVWFTGFVITLAGARLATNPIENQETPAPTFQPLSAAAETTSPPAPVAASEVTYYTPRPNRLIRPAALLEQSPVVWLLNPPDWMWTLIWAGAVVMGLVWFQIVAISESAGIFAPLVGLVMLANFLLAPTFDFLVAWQASRFFADARRSDSLELLLVTPNFRATAIQGIWRSLRATFLRPIIVMLLLRLLGTLVAMVSVGESSRGFNMWGEFGVPVLLFGTLGKLASFAALAWFGIWEGWNSRRPAFAATKTFILASLLPSILSWPVFGMSIGWRGGTPIIQLFWLVAYAGLAAWAYVRLKRTFLAGSAPVEQRRT